MTRLFPLLALALIAAAPSASAQAFLLKQDASRWIEGCVLSHDQAAVEADPGLHLTATCRDACFGKVFNDWLGGGPGRAEEWFDRTRSLPPELSRAAIPCMRSRHFLGLAMQCDGRFADDVMEVLGPPRCGERVACRVRFDVSADGSPLVEKAICEPGPARELLEREAVCLIRTMSFPAIAGRENVVQPYSFQQPATGPGCLSS